MSKVFKYVKLPLIVVLALVMQIIVANNLEIFGVTPNIVLVTIVIVSMWNDLTTSVIISCLIGIGADFIFHFNIGQSFISYLVIAVCISFISKKYRKDSKAAIVYITIMATLVLATFQYIYYTVDTGILVNVLSVLKQTVVELLLNIGVSYILYKVFEKSMKKRELDNIYM